VVVVVIVITIVIVIIVVVVVVAAELLNIKIITIICLAPESTQIF